MSSDEPDDMTTAEVARRCRVTAPTVLEWMRAGKLKPSGKPSRGYLWRRADVEAMVRGGLTQDEGRRAAEVVRDQLDAALARAFPERRRGA